MKIKKKAPFTLLEIMIVILLIGLIGSVIGYNMKGSLDEGRAFKTKQAILQMQDILELELARNSDLTMQKIIENPKKYLETSGLVKNVDTMMKDGWGNPLQFSIHGNTGALVIKSDKLMAYENKKGRNSSKESKGGEDQD